MGSFCTSTPATTTTNQSQTFHADPRIQGAGTTALNMAQDAASQPFQAPAAPVADFNPFQTQAFSQIQGMQGGLNPYIANANASQTAAGTPLSQDDISKYLNPYSDQALADMKKYVFDPQRRNTMGNAVQSAGGVGAERLALTSQNLDKTQADAVSQADAGFYSNAANIAQQQKQMAANSAQGWLGLGLGAQGGNLQATGALAGAGNQQQALSQAQLNSPYQQTLARLAYPFQTSQFLTGIAGGLAPAFGGTTNGTGTGTNTPAQPSPFNQIAGLGLAGAGVAGSLGWNPFGGGGTNGTLESLMNTDTNGGPISSPFADGGEVEGEDSNPFGHVVDPILSGREASSIVPNIPLSMGSGQNTGAHLNLSPPQQQAGGSGGSSSGMGDVMKVASTVLPFLLARGGSVNPWEMGQGYDNGGDVEEVSPDQFNRLDEASVDYSRPLERPAPNLGMWPFNRGQADYKGDVTINPEDNSHDPMTGGPARAVGRWLGIGNGGASAAPVAAHNNQPAMVPPALNPSMTPDNIRAGSPRPGAYTMPPPNAIPTPPPQPTMVASGADRTGGYRPRGGLNSDMKISDFQMPKDQNPYPDALNRDWGQKAVRSPWMSLVEAGAKIAQSTQKPGAAIASGVQAGLGELSKQRTELRSEQQINQKADELYRHAKSELNKYTRKTPHELATEEYHRATLAKLRYQPVNYEMPDGSTVAAGYDPQHNTYVGQNGKPLTGGRVIARQTGAESATSRASRAMTAAKDDPNYASDQLGTINKWRASNNLPPQGSFALPKDKSELVIGHTYPTARGPATWNGTEFVQ